MKLLCDLYGVNAGAFYVWRRRGICARSRADEELTAQIRAIFEASRRTYGSPRVHAMLRHRGIRTGKKRVSRLMRAAGLQARTWRPDTRQTAANRFFGELPNRQQRLVTSRPDQVWVGDVTYIKVATRWHYLAVVLDKHSRRVLGWRLGPHRDLSLTMGALNDALIRRQPAAGLIFHSDRGMEYSAYAFRDRLTRLGIVQSMKRPAVITDNAYAESFFHSLKSELLWGRRFDIEAQVRKLLVPYIAHYNRTRLHSGIGFTSPIDYERMAA